MTAQFRHTISVVALVLLGWVPAAGQDKPRATEPDDKDERLGERLIRQAAADSEEDLMGSIIRLMSEASRKLEIEFDAGDQTQTVQRQILDGLDDAIKAAASQRRPRRRTGPPSDADKRRMPKGKRRTSDQGGRPTDSGLDSSSSSPSDAEGKPLERESTSGDLRELRRAWGHLPMREREEIIQGITESFLERYREWIERYYRALQETED
ncbi:MAG: hypothetical protein JSU86_10165 [Phycisphaerales bacterium]|nr:MAG: hypothetical protein JSU86_10165 [Phycisphaerales bacterium]